MSRKKSSAVSRRWEDTAELDRWLENSATAERLAAVGIGTADALTGTKREEVMSNHRFTLILSGISEITPELADTLFEATGGDIEWNMSDRVVFLEFDREADSLFDTVRSAISQAESAGVRVVRVESEAANTIAKINAELLGVGSGS
ncbi:MAG: hypothetical protein HUU20_20015 [Pirellulales bacterium]|nr:hypothetical protein [Pirellulales bacterium]